ncbi:MAG: Lacal_2735 family protein [Planctomycetota bacterium]
MFGFGKSKAEKLEAKIRDLRQQAYDLSHSNRTLSDKKTAEAEALEKQLAEIQE